MWDAVDHMGRWVEIDDQTAHVYKEMKRLWPELELKYCENPGIKEAPFLVVERLPDGREMAVMSVWQLDGRLLDLLHEADTTKHDVDTILAKKNAKAKAKVRGEQLYWRDYCRDVLVSAARHMGTSYTFKDPRPGHEGEIVKIEDDPAHRTVVK